VALRCRIVLAAGAGKTNLEIAAQIAVDVKTVALWRRRFLHGRAESLWAIAPGRGRKATYSADKIKLIFQATLALSNVARARGMAQVAKDVGLGRESLYKALAPGAKPRLDTILKVVRALGVRFSAHPA